MSHIHHPKHYNLHPTGIECIDIIEHFPFNVGNAIKYLWRADARDPEKAVEDLEKAAWYVLRELARRRAKDDVQTQTLSQESSS